ncbi:MAG: EAL domain-containing protein, partial [Rheinheimera sp.]
HGKTDTAKAFLTGMMSLMDAILDEPMTSVMSKLPLSKDIKDALTGEPGLLSDYLALVKCYEQAQWQQANQAIAQLALPAARLPDAYHEAVQWANTQMKALGES